MEVFCKISDIFKSEIIIRKTLKRLVGLSVVPTPDTQ